MYKNNQFYDSPELRKIAMLTLALCKKSTIGFHRSKEAEGYWSRMMKYWKSDVETIGYNVVYAALYCIHWGTYPKDMPDNSDLVSLVDLLKAEFLKVNADTACAKAKQYFGSSLTKVLKSRSPHGESRKWKSESYNLFLEDKMKFRLYGGELEISNLNLLRTSMNEFADMKEKAKSRYHYEKIKSNLMRLIPVACTWTDDDFSNDANIIAELQNLYGVNYVQHWKDFDCLMAMLDEADKKEPSIYRMLNISHFTYDMAKAIWPVNTEARLEEMFVCFCRKYKSYAAHAKKYSECSYTDSQEMRSYILNSWLYRELYGWYENKTHMLSDQTRKMLFDLSLGVS